MQASIVTTLKKRSRKAEDAVMVLQEGAHMSDISIAELVQSNTALEERAARASMT